MLDILVSVVAPDWTKDAHAVANDGTRCIKEINARLAARN